MIFIILGNITNNFDLLLKTVSNAYVFANKVVAITGHSQITAKVFTCSFFSLVTFSA